MFGLTKDYLLSLGEQVLFAYLGSFVALLLTGWTGTLDISVLTAAGVAALPAALAILKAAVAKKFGNPDSANFKG